MIILVKDKIPHGSFYFLILPDSAAGLPHRYTVYRVPSSPSGKIGIIGQELPLADARKVVKTWMAKNA